MTAHLPAIPRAIFTLFEPLSLLAGFLGPVVDSTYFISNQLPTPYKRTPDLTSQLLAWQLGNAYLLLGLVGVFVLNTTSELKVVRSYLWALWLGDIGHLAVTVYAMGWDATLYVQSWNAVVWGNIGATLFLFLVRTSYFAGLFGDAPRPVTIRARKDR